MSLPRVVQRLVPRALLRPRASAPSPADWALVQRIEQSVPTLRSTSDRQLIARMQTLRDTAGEERPEPDSLIESAFALVSESVRRHLGYQYYDVQLLAGLALVRGSIAEMATGEGKTLVQALAAAVFALRGRGVHVMTSNAYLAQRDFEQLEPVYRQLGLTAGLVEAQAPAEIKRRAYQADVTYGAGYEFGFDYLRDQIQIHQRKQPELGGTLREQLRGESVPAAPPLQRGQAVALIDEADSVLIDEATTPLLLSSGPSGTNAAANAYLAAAHIAAQLQPGSDYVVEGPQRRAQLTQRGLAVSLDGSLHPRPTQLHRPWVAYIEQALAAKLFLCRDVDYVIEGERIVLVDQATGRIFADRSWRQGLHQAVEAKEGVPVTPPRRTLARISRQQYFRLYTTICGMTGTAHQAARELWEIYRLPVTLIPTRKPCRREVVPARYFATCEAKYDAMVESIRQRHATRQPILVGTRSIEESRVLAERIQAVGVRAQLLNGTQDLDEAQIVARAGHRDAVTIATNIAGRGTDIPLGPGVVELGGLHVIVGEPNVSSRIDRQLIGRAARQGDPGSCQMFVSAEDELIRLFATRLARTMRRLATADGEIRDDLAGEIARVQRRVEQAGFENRRKLLQSDAWRERVLAKLTGAK